MRWPSATQWKNSTVPIKSVQHFTRNTSASVAVTFALMSAVLFLICACAIDFGRLLIVHDRLQNALDSAVQRAAADTEAPDRIALASAFFDAANGVLVEDAQATFAIDAATKLLNGRATKQLPMTLASAFIPFVDIGVSASAPLAVPKSVALDLVLCIDSTQGMGTTLSAIKAVSLSLRERLEAQMAPLGVRSFAQVRVRYIYYKDFGGFATDDALRVSQNYILVPYEMKWPSSAAGGDPIPLSPSSLYTLPDQSTALSGFTDYGVEGGGSTMIQADSGLECLNEALNTSFVKAGNLVAGTPVDIAMPVIAVYTNKAAHPPYYSFSVMNPKYPPKDYMPATYDDLRAKWNDGRKIDQSSKLMLFFGTPSQTHGGLLYPLNGTVYGVSAPDTQDEYSNFKPMYTNGWTVVSKWPGFKNPATLSNIDTDFIPNLATNIAAQYNKLIAAQ